MSDLWDTWVGKVRPAEFLRWADQAVAAGRFPSRRAVFVEHARRALCLLQPDVPVGRTPETLGGELLEYAEGSEFVGP